MTFCPFCEKEIERGRMREHCDTHEHVANSTGSGDWAQRKKPNLDEMDRRAR